MKKLSRAGLLLVFSCLLMGWLSSCGSDEPEAMTIGYYMEVEEAFLVNGSSNYSDGYLNPKTIMLESIRKVYPTPDADGNDQAVIKACDEAYAKFYQDYSGSGDHLTCLLHLIRAKMQGTIVRSSERLKTYNIDVNPIPPGD